MQGVIYTSKVNAFDLQNKLLMQYQDFTKNYKGKINDTYQIKMTLTKIGNKLKGSYYYTSQNKPLRLSGTINEYGTIYLNEYNDSGSITGIFEGNLTNSSISGYWRKPDGSKQMPFHVQEIALAQNNSVDGIYEYEFYTTFDGQYQLYASASVGIKLVSKQKFEFSINVATAPGCEGFVEGYAVLKNGIWYYSGEGCGKLTFSFKSNYLIVDEDDCLDLHGAGCSFAHKYTKK